MTPRKNPPRPHLYHNLSLFLPSSTLFAAPPSILNGHKIRASIYSLTGGKPAEVWAGTDLEIKIPIDNLARGRYFFELKGARLNKISLEGLG